MPRRKAEIEVDVVPTIGELTTIESGRIWRQIEDVGRFMFGCHWKHRTAKILKLPCWSVLEGMLSDSIAAGDGKWMDWMWMAYEDESARLGEIARAAASEQARLIVGGREILTRDKNHQPPVDVPWLPWDRPAMPPSAAQVVDELHARAAARYAEADAQADDEEAA